MLNHRRFLFGKSVFLAVLAAALFASSGLHVFAAYRTTARVNLRSGASLQDSVLLTLDADISVEVGEYTEDWSKVSVNGVEGFVKSEYLASSGQAEETSPAEYRTNDRVNLRANASLDADVLKTLNTGLMVEMLSYDPEGWSKVNAGGIEGFIKSEYLTQKDPSQYRATTAVNFRSAPSTDADVLKKIGAGTAVTMLTYNPEGWSKVSLNGVEGFIKSEYLTSADAYGGGISANGVELIKWEDAKKIFKTYTPATVYDVRSGAVYMVQSFSNGSHADVEPLTKADTEILHKTFGNRWSWDVRPVWVTIGGRTMAASINGMPHGGGTISGNGMNGQICIHFLDSKTHNGNKSFEKTHQSGVMEAWNAR